MLFAKIATLFAAAALCTDAKVHPKPDPNAIGRCHYETRDCTGYWHTVDGNQKGASAIWQTCLSFETWHPLKTICSDTDCIHGCEGKGWTGASCVTPSGANDQVKCVITT